MDLIKHDRTKLPSLWTLEKDPEIYVAGTKDKETDRWRIMYIFGVRLSLECTRSGSIVLVWVPQLDNNDEPKGLWSQ